MKTLRKANERGRADFGWLDSRHSFSFGEYFDPEYMGYGPIRVLNDDRIAGGGGFPLHPHADMEIFSYVPEGQLAHQDSLGNGSTIGRNKVQLMGAGTGIRHSEYNPSETEPVHLLQVWIEPRKKGLAPNYQERDFPAPTPGEAVLRRIIAPDTESPTDALAIRQDVTVYSGHVPAGGNLTLPLADGERGWLQMISGDGRVGDQPVATGDGLAVEQETDPVFAAEADSEFLWFRIAG
ncbi:MAG: pirin family protein [Opitutales bacterium]